MYITGFMVPKLILFLFPMSRNITKLVPVTSAERLSYLHISTFTYLHITKFTYLHIYFNININIFRQLLELHRWRHHNDVLACLSWNWYGMTFFGGGGDGLCVRKSLWGICGTFLSRKQLRILNQEYECIKGIFFKPFIQYQPEARTM